MEFRLPGEVDVEDAEESWTRGGDLVANDEEIRDEEAKEVEEEKDVLLVKGRSRSKETSSNLATRSLFNVMSKRRRCWALVVVVVVVVVVAITYNNVIRVKSCDTGRFLACSSLCELTMSIAGFFWGYAINATSLLKRCVACPDGM